MGSMLNLLKYPVARITTGMDFLGSCASSLGTGLQRIRFAYISPVVIAQGSLPPHMFMLSESNIMETRSRCLSLRRQN